MLHMYRFLALCVLGVIAAVASAQGQTTTPFRSQDALDFARAAAVDSLGDDVVLIGIASTGDTQNGPGFDVSNGTSSMWIYFYFSPSIQKGLALVTLQIAPETFFGAGQIVNDEEGVNVDYAIATDGAYATSDRLASAVLYNADYQDFLEKHGAADVELVGISRPGTVEPHPPTGFPMDAPVWTSTFSAGGDTTKVLHCFTSASNGYTVCVDNAISSVEDESSAAARLTMSVAPNPAVGRTRVTITPRENGRSTSDMHVGLFNAVGEQVLDLTESFAASGHQHAEFDAGALSAGQYYVRVVGGGLNGVVATVSLGR